MIFMVGTYNDGFALHGRDFLISMVSHANSCVTYLVA